MGTAKLRKINFLTDDNLFVPFNFVDSYRQQQVVNNGLFIFLEARGL